MIEDTPIDWKVFLLLIEGVFFVSLVSLGFSLVFPWFFLGFSLVSLGFSLVSLVWRCTLPQNKPTPPTPSIKPETFLPIVPRGTPD